MRAVCLISLALVLASPPAEAASSRAKRTAKRWFDKAETEYKLGRFQEALELYQRAYQALPEPAFLFNIGQCHRNLGDLDRALYFFRGFLNETKDARAKERVERLIEEIKAKQEQERLDEDAKVKTGTVSLALPEPKTATIAPAIERPPPEPPSASIPAWPFIVAAVVVAVGGGIAIAVVATRNGGVPEDAGDFFLDWRDR